MQCDIFFFFIFKESGFIIWVIIDFCVASLISLDYSLRRRLEYLTASKMHHIMSMSIYLLKFIEILNFKKYIYWNVSWCKQFNLLDITPLKKCISKKYLNKNFSIKCNTDHLKYNLKQIQNMERRRRQKKRWKIGTFFNLPSNSIQPDRAWSNCLFQIGSNQVR